MGSKRARGKAIDTRWTPERKSWQDTATAHLNTRSWKERPMTFRHDSPRGDASGPPSKGRPRTRRPAQHDGGRGGSRKPLSHGDSPWGRSRREWGQNFFRSASSARRFAGQLSEGDGSAITVEIGAGSGRITQELTAPGHPVIAIEIDPHWADRLTEGAPANLTVVNHDFMDWRLPGGPARFIGNLPFGTGTAMLRRCLEAGPDRLKEGVFLLQEEYTRKRVGVYGGNLFNAQWAPWYTFDRGLRFFGSDFRPVPRTDTETLLVSPLEQPLVPWPKRSAYQRFVDEVFTTGHLTIGEAARKVQRRGHAEWLRKSGVVAGTRIKDVSHQKWADLFLTLAPAGNGGHPRARRPHTKRPNARRRGPAR